MNIEKLLYESKKVEVSYLNHKSVCADTLRNIMNRDNLTEVALANILGVEKLTIEHYLEGRTIPNCAKMLIALIWAHPEVIDMIRIVKVVAEE